jgi:hypothetical protein
MIKFVKPGDQMELIFKNVVKNFRVTFPLKPHVSRPWMGYQQSRQDAKNHQITRNITLKVQNYHVDVCEQPC